MPGRKDAKKDFPEELNHDSMEHLPALSHTLPVKFPVAFFKAGLHPFNDGLPHTGN